MTHRTPDGEAPDFTRTDTHGNQIHLSDYKNRLNVVLVFNRGFA